MSDRERLIAAFLDGEAAPEDRDALFAGLQRDPAFARDVASLLVTERLLRLHRSDGEAFAREVLERLRAGGGSRSGGVFRRRGRLALLAGAAALLIGVLAVLVFRPGARSGSPSFATIGRVEGIVQVQRSSGFMLRAEAGQVVEPGDRVSTQRGSQAEIRYGGGATLILGADTSVSGYVRVVTVGTSERPGLFLRVERGGVTADVSPRGNEGPVTFQVPYGEVTVLGTRLRIQVTPGDARVAVETGRVRVTRTDRATTEVGEGESAVLGPGIALIARPLRAETGLVALYKIRESRGGRVRDVSGVQPPLDFTIKDEAGRALVEPWKIDRGVTVSFVQPPTRLVEAVRKSREITIEMWLQRQGERSVSHVVRTYDPSGVVRVYGNGVERTALHLPLDLASWDGDFRVLLSEGPSRPWPWPGEYHLVAIHDRSLSAEEVRKYFERGRSR